MKLLAERSVRAGASLVASFSAHAIEAIRQIFLQLAGTTPRNSTQIQLVDPHGAGAEASIPTFRRGGRRVAVARHSAASRAACASGNLVQAHTHKIRLSSSFYGDVNAAGESWTQLAEKSAGSIFEKGFFNERARTQASIWLHVCVCSLRGVVAPPVSDRALLSALPCDSIEREDDAAAAAAARELERVVGVAEGAAFVAALFERMRGGGGVHIDDLRHAAPQCDEASRIATYVAARVAPRVAAHSRGN
eukprot:6188940-Pleurochrysis_carterae.AAC.1